METAIFRPLRPMYPVIRGLAALASLGVVLSCGWLATMELFLRQPDSGWRFVVETEIVLEAAFTIAVLEDLVTARRSAGRSTEELRPPACWAGGSSPRTWRVQDSRLA